MTIGGVAETCAEKFMNKGHGQACKDGKREHPVSLAKICKIVNQKDIVNALH